MISSRLFTSSCFYWTQIVHISSDCKISVIIFHLSEAKRKVRFKRTLQSLAEDCLHPPASRRLAAEHWVQIMLQEQLYKRQTVKGKSPDPLSKYGRENFTVKKTNFELNFFDCVSFYRARPWFFVRKSSQWTNKRKRLSIKKHENWKKIKKSGSLLRSQKRAHSHFTVTKCYSGEWAMLMRLTAVTPGHSSDTHTRNSKINRQLKQGENLQK